MIHEKLYMWTQETWIRVWSSCLKEVISGFYIVWTETLKVSPTITLPNVALDWRETWNTYNHKTMQLQNTRYKAKTTQTVRGKKLSFLHLATKTALSNTVQNVQHFCPENPELDLLNIEAKCRAESWSGLT